MAGRINLILEAAKFDASSASSSEASLTDSECHRHPNEQEHYSDDLGKYHATLTASSLH